MAAHARRSLAGALGWHMTVTYLLEFVRKSPVLGLGRGCLFVGALMVVSAVGSVAALAAVQAAGGRTELTSATPSGLASFQLRYHRPLTVLQIGLGVVVALTGMAVLQRRRWARALLEGLAWLGLLVTTVQGPLFIYSWHSASGSLMLFVLFGGSVVTLVLVAASIVFIRFLRSSVVREAFNPS